MKKGIKQAIVSTVLILCMIIPGACATNDTPPAHEHEYTEKVSEATCEQDGLKSYTCTCGDERTERIEAIGHTWDEGTESVAPECKKDGERIYTCSVCKATRTEAIAATGVHVWSDGEMEQEATCTEEGRLCFSCLFCEETREEVIPVTEHSWVDGEIILPSTCATPGEMTVSCFFCGETTVETIPVNEEHVWKEGEITVSPTCMTTGTSVVACEVCGLTREEELPVLTDHNWDEGVVQKKATCTEKGESLFACKDCGETKTEQTALSTSHSYGKGVVTKEATCGTNGVRTYTCTVCKKVKTETIAATKQHIWDQGKVTKEATVLSAGVRTYTCTLCNETKTSSIAKLVDEKTTVYSTDRILYVGELPVYGVVRIDGKYYIPLEMLTDDNIMGNQWQRIDETEEYYSISILRNGLSGDIPFINYKTKVPDSVVIGTAKKSDKYLKFNNTEIRDAVWELSGDFPMVRLDAIGAVAQGDDFYLSVSGKQSYRRVDENDLIGEVLPKLQRTTKKETVIAIHDYLVNTLTYDPRVSWPSWMTDELYNELEAEEKKVRKSYKTSNNIVLAMEYGVCQDYAELFRSMCNRSGIPCVLVTGLGNFGSHAWNKVYLDGQWLYVDCTFDDPVSKTPVYRDDYCLVGPDTMAYKHVWDDDDYPMPKEYDPAWEKLDIKNITSADMFRKCLVAQVMQKKTSFSLRLTGNGKNGGIACISAYDTDFMYISMRYNSKTKEYDVEVEYWD